MRDKRENWVGGQHNVSPPKDYWARRLLYIQSQFYFACEREDEAGEAQAMEDMNHYTESRMQSRRNFQGASHEL